MFIVLRLFFLYFMLVCVYCKNNSHCFKNYKTSVGGNLNDFISPHQFQIDPSLFEQDDCTAPKCGDLSEYTDSAHTEAEGLSSRCTNASNVYDWCWHDTSHSNPFCTVWNRTANLPGPAGQNKACSRPHHSNHLAKWKEYIGWCGV